MLSWLGELLTPFYGPFRLLYSYLFLAGLGAALGAISTLFLLPKLWNWLPRDNGRIYAVDGEKARGKPVSAGAVFIPLFVLVCLLVVPFNWQLIGILACLMLAMFEGHLDDMKTDFGTVPYAK